MDSKRELIDLHGWFEELWNDEKRVEDVKDAVLAYLRQAYRDQSGEAGAADQVSGVEP